MKNTNEMKHTPIPWGTKGKTIKALNSPYIGMVVAEACEPGALTREEVTANAEFIVRAVNAHEEMLEALKTALNNLGQCFHPLTGEERCYCRATTQIQDAIAKATGQTTQ